MRAAKKILKNLSIKITFIFCLSHFETLIECSCLIHLIAKGFEYLMSHYYCFPLLYKHTQLE